jgi:hypothetical protein
MNTTYKLRQFTKAIFYLPVNLSSIIIDINRIENKIDLLNKRLDELDLNLTLGKEANLHSQQEHNDCNKFSLSSEISGIFENNFLQIEALLSIYNSLPSIKHLPATRGWAGSPDFLNKIIEIILKEKQNFVLEASSGASSVIIGLAIKMNNYGEALSFEHDPLYAKITRKNIEINDLVDVHYLR